MSLRAVSRVKGSSCPGCGHGDGGIEFQAGLHQDPIVQCIHCAARIFVGVDGYRAVIPEDKAPPVRRDFLMARAFDSGLDGLNRQIADFEGIVREHETKAAYWRRRVAVVRAEREEFLGVKRSGIDVGSRTAQKALADAAPSNVVESEQSGATQ